ncbi:MAG: mechanosensitive ion channel [Thermodesulfobacteriota bacterium]|nr:mechanosensitive ion channel [Thermodesulfobacteriota bacterium]
MQFLETLILGNTVYDYAVAVVIFIAAVLFCTMANRFLKKYAYSWAKKTASDVDDLIVKRIFSPVTFLILVAGIAMAKGHLKVAERVSFWIDRVLLVLGLAIFFFLLIRVFQGLTETLASGYNKRLKQEGPTGVEEQINTVNRIKKQVVEIGNMVLGVLAVLTILSNLGLDLKAIWASLGIGGIALVVAVQEPLRNLVGRVYIFSTGIFDEGHFIVFGESAGTVKRISAFRTYLELFTDMTTVSIPNADFVKGVVKTYYGRTKFMYKWDLDVPYDVAPGKIQELVVQLRELVTGKPEVNKDMCWIYLERLDRYSKVVRVWFQAGLSSWAKSLFYGNQVLHEIQLVFESMGIPFAFPTQTLLVNPQDPAPVVLPEPESKA